MNSTKNLKKEEKSCWVQVQVSNREYQNVKNKSAQIKYANDKGPGSLGAIYTAPHYGP